jgi:acyl transferase domain-containing protein
MGEQLYRSQPTFREVLDRCAGAADLARDLLEVVFEPECSDELADTRYTQPAVFAVDLATAHMWQSFGVTPHFVLGHSLGELAAACFSGLFALEDGMRLACLRGELMSGLPSGAMAAVTASEPQILEAVAASPGRVSIAAWNGPEQATLSGSSTDLEDVLARLAAAGARVRRLRVSLAFHSAVVDSITDEFAATACKVTLRAPTAKFVSCVTGRLTTADTLTDPDYWKNQIRAPVLFRDGIHALLDSRCRRFIEVGPGRALTAMAASCATDVEDAVWAASSCRGHAEWRELLRGVGELYRHGATIDFRAIEAGFSPRKKRTLPGYPFQRQRCWPVDAEHASTVGARPDLPTPAPEPASEEHGIRTRLSAAAVSRRRAILEEYLVALFEEHLSTSTPIGPKDHYMQCGIDSLTALRITSQIRTDLGGLAGRLPASLVLRHPTILHLAEHLAARLKPVTGGGRSGRHRESSRR